MSPAIVFALGTPVVLGFCVVSLLWPRTDRDFQSLAVRAGLGAGVGSGMVSALYFLWLVFIGSPQGYFVFETLLLAGLIVFTVRSRPPRQPQTHSDRPATRIPRGVLVAALLLGLIATVNFTLLSLKRPHGNWDAWAIWNLRAKMLVGRGNDLAAVFSPELGWSHVDYPLLVSGMVARSWMMTGATTPAVPIAVAALFTVATVGLLASALWMLRGPTIALLGGGLLLGTSAFVRHSANQLADIPLGFFILATLALLHLAANRRRYHYYVLAGVTAGLAAWTKNEGLLFVSVLLAVSAGAALVRHGWIGLRPTFLPLLLGALPGLAVVGYLKLAWAGSNDLFVSAPLPELLGRVLAPERTLFILAALVRMVFSVEWLLPLVALVLAFAVIAGDTSEEVAPTSVVSFGWLILLFVFFGYLMVYQITPHDLSWHISSSLDRLVLYLWPGVILSPLLSTKAIRSLIRYLGA